MQGFCFRSSPPNPTRPFASDVCIFLTGQRFSPSRRLSSIRTQPTGISIGVSFHVLFLSLSLSLISFYIPEKGILNISPRKSQRDYKKRKSSFIGIFVCSLSFFFFFFFFLLLDFYSRQQNAVSIIRFRKFVFFFLSFSSYSMFTRRKLFSFVQGKRTRLGMDPVLRAKKPLLILFSLSLSFVLISRGECGRKYIYTEIRLPIPEIKN